MYLLFDVFFQSYMYIWLADILYSMYRFYKCLFRAMERMKLLRVHGTE